MTLRRLAPGHLTTGRARPDPLSGRGECLSPFITIAEHYLTLAVRSPRRKLGSASQLRPRRPPTWHASRGTPAHSLDPKGGGPGLRVEAYCLRLVGRQFESRPLVLTSLRRDSIATSHNHRRFKPTRSGKGVPCARTVIETCKASIAHASLSTQLHTFITAMPQKPS